MKRVLIAVLLILLVLGALLGWKYYRWIYHPNTQSGESDILFVHDTMSVEDLSQTLVAQNILVNARSFKWVARRMKFGDESIKEGRYFIPSGLSNYRLLQKLRLGQQDAIDLVIHSSPTMEELAGAVASQVEFDSMELLTYLRQEYIPQSDYSQETLLSLFIPNTYEVWWNIKPQKFIERMVLEHDRFWNPVRLARANALGLTPVEVYTLASIVESETQARDERATIAGVYLNRIAKGIPLQADPTVRFALQDRTIRRVLLKHLEIESPYNTYLYAGLPPGPITMPSINSIDAVLNAEDHDYLFFCAKPGYEGRHAFAKSLTAHLANARIYQSWLNAEGIR